MGKPLIEAGGGSRISVDCVGSGEEIAHVVVLLARDAYIAGRTIAVNGGALFSRQKIPPSLFAKQQETLRA
jgi:hypothetical protein